MEDIGIGGLFLMGFLGLALARSLVLACWPDSVFGNMLDGALGFFEGDGDCDGGGDGGGGD